MANRPSTAYHPNMRCLQDGILGGLVGGVLLAALLALTRGLSSLGQVVGIASPFTGLGMVVLFAVIVGALFAVLARGRFTSNLTYTLAGMALAVAVWAVLVLGILPRVASEALDHPWEIHRPGEAAPTLLGSLIFGLAMGKTYDFLQCRGCAE